MREWAILSRKPTPQEDLAASKGIFYGVESKYSGYICGNVSPKIIYCSCITIGTFQPYNLDKLNIKNKRPKHQCNKGSPPRRSSRDNQEEAMEFSNSPGCYSQDSYSPASPEQKC